MQLRATLVAVATLALTPLAGCPEEPKDKPKDKGDDLRIAVTAIDFGVVVLGATATADVQIINDAEAAFDPAAAPALEGADAAAFAITTPCALPLGSGELCTITVSFTPTEARAHTAALRIDASTDVVIPITGAVRGVRITPDPIDFGTVPRGSQGEATVTVENIGADAITDLAFDTEGAGFGFIGGAPSLDLDPGESDTFEVFFAPAQLGAATGALSALFCAVDAPDAASCNPSVALAGVGADAELEVTPTPIDFGEVALGASEAIDVVIANTGGAPLTVEAVTLVDTTGALDLSLAGVTAPFVVAPGTNETVALTFAPTQGVASLDGALVRITSNDRDLETLDVPVAGSCDAPGIVFEPLALDFGTIDENESEAQTVTLRSVGTADAVVTALSFAPDDGTFAIVSAPPLPFTLAPGASADVSVRATAALAHLESLVTGTLEATVTNAGVATLPLQFAGGFSACVPERAADVLDFGAVALNTTVTASVAVTNVGTGACVFADAFLTVGAVNDPEFEFDASDLALIPPGETRRMTFLATPGTEELVRASVSIVFEHSEDPLLLLAQALGRAPTMTPLESATFSALPPLCGGGTSVIHFRNDGTGLAVIAGARVEPATAPFEIIDPTGFPISVPVGGNIAITVRRLGALQEGAHTAQLILVADTVAATPGALSSSVSPPGAPIVEQFIAPGTADLDVLFVVDNSGSMADDQLILRNNFTSFINQPEITNGTVDFHIGVTTTDIFAEAGDLVGAPHVLTNVTPNVEAAFSANADVGTGGSGDERGLEALRLALSEPAASTTNAGFYRRSAALAIIIVSDEEDFSTGLVTDYTDFLHDLKGGGLADQLINVSAVREPFASTRYDTVVNEFGGLLLDISQPDWGTQLAALGQEVFDLPQLISLSLPPDVGTVVVTVDGVATTPAQVDEAHGIVAFQPKVPAGSVIEVTYDADCP